VDLHWKMKVLILLIVLLINCIRDAVCNRTSLADLEAFRLSFPPQRQQGNKATFSLYTGNNSDVIMVAHNDLYESFFGNRLGRYLEAVACCDLLGLHYVNIGSKENTSFVKAIPFAFVHKLPARNISYAKEAVKTFCPMMTSWPWAIDGAWVSRVAALGQIVAHAIDATHPHVEKQSMRRKSFSAIRTGPNLTLFDEELPVTADENSLPALPFIPDVALVFRCIDILTFSVPSHYGFVNFDVYSNLVPSTAKNIYVLSESLHYLQKSENNSKAEICINISLSLVEHLAERFPAATVALRRGYAMEHFIVIQKAPTVVCTPTSFCFFALLAGRNDGYFQSSCLVSWRPFIRDNFHYIVAPPLHYFDNTLTNKTRADDPKALPEILQRLRAPIALEQIQLETSAPGHGLGYS
jgi:hypothetical protein